MYSNFKPFLIKYNTEKATKVMFATKYRVCHVDKINNKVY